MKNFFGKYFKNLPNVRCTILNPFFTLYYPTVVQYEQSLIMIKLRLSYLSYWFELRSNVRGNSLTIPSINSTHPIWGSIKLFINNTAHSNGGVGLRTYPNGMRPRVGWVSGHLTHPCVKIISKLLLNFNVACRMSSELLT